MMQCSPLNGTVVIHIHIRTAIAIMSMILRVSWITGVIKSLTRIDRASECIRIYRKWILFLPSDQRSTALG